MNSDKEIKKLYRRIDDRDILSHKRDATTKFTNWLRETVSETNKDERDLPPKWIKICFIITANQGWDFKGWGAGTGKYRGHQVGLDQDDALSLLFYTGFLTGVSAMTQIDAFLELQPYFTWYTEKYVEKTEIIT